MNKGMLFYYDWVLPFSMLDGEDFKKLVLGMVEYHQRGEKPKDLGREAYIISLLVMPQIDRMKENVSNGKRGGRPKKECQFNKYEEVQQQGNTERVKDEPRNEQTGEDRKEIKEEAPPKRVYGKLKNVHLTDGEYESLKKEFPRDYERRIDDLSTYMASKGINYASHYGTILSWARKGNVREEREPENSTFDTDDFFQAALERSERELRTRRGHSFAEERQVKSKSEK